MRIGRLFTAAIATMVVATAALGPSSAESTRPWNTGVESWITDLNTDQRLARQSGIGWRAGPGAPGRTIVVDPTRRYQRMTGFGASMTDSSAYVLSRLEPGVRREVMRDLFSPSEGIGISMLRQPMGASDFAVDRAYSYDDQPQGRTDPDLSDFSIRHDLAYILPRLREARALNRNITFMATPWSAPGWMKDNDSMITGSLLPRYHQAYADYFAEFIKAYRRAGIPTDYVSMQNEPLYEPADYPGMEVLPDQAATFLGRYLGPTLAREGLDNTEILGYDHNWDVTDYPEAMYADRRARRYVPGTAWHCYAGEVVAQSISHNNYPHAQAFQTECSGGQWQGPDGIFDQDFAFDQTMASMIDGPRNWNQSVVFWNLALDQQNGPFIGGCDVCRGVVTVDTDTGRVTKEMEFWALGHATRFVRPGSVRIGSSAHPTAADPAAENRGLTNVAFSTRDGGQVMLAHNATGTAQTFDVQVGSRHFSATLAAGAAATYRWRAPADLVPAPNLGWVDLDYGPGPAGTPAGRLTASVGPEVVGALTQVKLGGRWVGYTLPYGAELRFAAPVRTVSRAGWTLSAVGVKPVEKEPLGAMLDNNRATRWSSGVGQTAEMSLTVDLGRETTFSEIALDAATSRGDYLRRYSVEVSTDGTTWEEIARGTGKPSLTGITKIMLPQTTARKLRLVSDTSSGSWWSIHELDLGLALSGAAAAPGRRLISDRGTLPDGTPVTGHYNPGRRAAFAPWPAPGFDYTYWLPPRAAVTFAVSGAEPALRIEPRTDRRIPLTPGG